MIELIIFALAILVFFVVKVCINLWRTCSWSGHDWYDPSPEHSYIEVCAICKEKRYKL